MSDRESLNRFFLVWLLLAASLILPTPALAQWQVPPELQSQASELSEQQLQFITSGAVFEYMPERQLEHEMATRDGSDTGQPTVATGSSVPAAGAGGRPVPGAIGNFRILSKLGEGGMGVVYKAEDLSLERPVALKFLSPRVTGTERDRARFVHEAKAAASLNHPNICTIYEIGEDDGSRVQHCQYHRSVVVGSGLTACQEPEDVVDVAVVDGSQLAVSGNLWRGFSP